MSEVKQQNQVLNIESEVDNSSQNALTKKHTHTKVSSNISLDVDNRHIYEYVYTTESKKTGKLLTKKIKIKSNYQPSVRYKEETDKLLVIETINKYLNDNNINIDKLKSMKISQIDNMLNPLKKYILIEIKLFVNQPIIKNLIMKDIRS